MTYVEIILLVLKILNFLIETGQKYKWIAEGERQAAARSLAKTLLMIGARDEIERHVRELSDAQLDDELRDLEPK